MSFARRGRRGLLVLKAQFLALKSPDPEGCHRIGRVRTDHLGELFNQVIQVNFRPRILVKQLVADCRLQVVIAAVILIGSTTTD